MRVRKKFTFEAAHRLPKHGGRCAGLHGHSYKVEVILEGDISSETGMVVDFGEIKKSIGSFIDRFDHSLILSDDDSFLGDVFNPALKLDELNKRWMVVPYQPTAEMMAAHIFFEACARLQTSTVAVHSVRVHETETGWAECDRIMGIDFGSTTFSAATVVESR